MTPFYNLKAVSTYGLCNWEEIVPSTSNSMFSRCLLTEICSYRQRNNVTNLVLVKNINLIVPITDCDIFIFVYLADASITSKMNITKQGNLT